MARRMIYHKRSSAGAPPGTLIADPASAPTSIDYFSYDEDACVAKGPIGIGEVAKVTGSRRVTWINIIGLSDIALIEAIGRQFNLHRLALEDVINVHQRPKVEEYDDQLFMVTRMMTGASATDTEQVSIFLGKGYVLTFQERPGDVFEPVRQRLRRDGGQIRKLDADYLAYALLDAVIDGYFPVLEQRGEEVEQLEDQVINEPRESLLRVIHEAKRDLLNLRRAVWPQREMLSALLRQDGKLIAEPTKVYLRDCYDHVIQLIDIIETYREVCSGLVETYLSSLSNRMNEIMKVLTIMATVFIPLSFLAGLYGMNFDRSVSPWNMPELGWFYGYPFALGLMATVAGGLMWWFWRRGWIGWAEDEE